MEPFDVDILSLGGWSDALWSVKTYNPACYKYSVPRSPEQIKVDVLNSRRVRHIIETVRVTTGYGPCLFKVDYGCMEHDDVTKMIFMK